MTRPGILYVVATPLGNLDDLSPRAAQVLRRVQVVAAEDTRRTRTLLTHVGGKGRLVSYHAHSPGSRAEAIVELVRLGEPVALVTDAGTPGVSDPGAALVAAVRAAGGQVVPIPGPSAVAAALSASGLPADRFTFLGFSPRKGPPREQFLRRAAEEPYTVILFEAPGRLGTLLSDLARVAGSDRRAVLARELTKVHEELLHGTLGELARRVEDGAVRGECTLVLAGTGRELEPSPDRDRAARVAVALVRAGVERSSAARIVAEGFELPRNESYRLTQEAG